MPSKFRNVRTGRHASKKEARRAAELQLLQKIGQIKDLREQVSYLLIPSQMASGGCIERACKYVADFVYEQDGATVVEDTKGVRTPAYVIKRKLMLKIHGIRITEV
ncbi:MAG TPA: DUF1064 domain-containing protein [Acidobacteriaceae bacterium]|nr:DUF1064 domain-containing protein [Acidobacteriaceae bacterium]